MKRKGITGMKLWHYRVQENYSTLEELKSYDELYDIAKRCGFDSCEELWESNPMLQGSVHPADFGIAK